MKFKQIIQERILQEKQILFGDGASYNQAVFLAGGTGSGKGFASKQFMQGQKFKRFDVDRWKEGFMDLARKTDKYPELEDLDLQNPEDVSRLHSFVKDKGIHNKFVNNVLKNAEAGRLPNVMFDVTLARVSKLHKFLPILQQSGYSPQNIHLVWVLTDYEIAVKRNRSRERIVPDDVLLKTHEGAAGTIAQLVNEGLPRGMDGSVHVILNNPEQTLFFADENGDPIEVPKDEFNKNIETKKVIKDFTYLTLKPEGKPFRSVLEIKENLAQWIKRNAPKTTDVWSSLTALH